MSLFGTNPLKLEGFSPLDAHHWLPYHVMLMAKRLGWDRLGILFSAICIIHCLAVPVILILFPVFGLHLIPGEDWTHAILFAFILGVAGFAFVTGYRVHGQWRPVAWMALGVLIVSYATFFVHRQLGHQWEPAVAIFGSLALIRAHYLNHKCKKCEHEHEHHHHN